MYQLEAETSCSHLENLECPCSSLINHSVIPCLLHILSLFDIICNKPVELGHFPKSVLILSLCYKFEKQQCFNKFLMLHLLPQTGYKRYGARFLALELKSGDHAEIIIMPHPSLSWITGSLTKVILVYMMSQHWLRKIWPWKHCNCRYSQFFIFTVTLAIH